jgi:hypothetical protein
MAEKEWRAQSEAQMMSMDTNMRALAALAPNAPTSSKPSLPSSPGAGLAPETERVLSAYQSENEQLRAALAAARQSPVGPAAGVNTGGPSALYGRTSPPKLPGGRWSSASAGMPLARLRARPLRRPPDCRWFARQRGQPRLLRRWERPAGPARRWPRAIRSIPTAPIICRPIRSRSPR